METTSSYSYEVPLVQSYEDNTPMQLHMPEIPIPFPPGKFCLSFRELKYTVNKGTSGEKEILCGLTSSIPCNKLTALFGPTGSDCLAARKAKTDIDGLIMVNGVKRVESKFKPLVGYVVQSDILMGNLTCRENIMFSADLRLSRAQFNQEQRAEIVQEVIDNLGLGLCADTLAGDEMVRGLSGGERKRTMIACELIIRPLFLLLDEPTSGLDAATSVSIIEQLRKLAHERNVTVLMSIHQPRYSIWKQLDHVMVMSRGHLIYSGLSTDVPEYFKSIGYFIESHDNPADFLLDVLSGIIQYENPDDLSNGLSANFTTDDSQTNVSFYTRIDRAIETHDLLLRVWQEKGLEEISSYSNSSSDNVHFMLPPRLSFFEQFRIICIKTLTGMKRVPHIVILQMCAMVFFALVTGGIYYKQKLDQTGLQNRLGAFFFLIMSMVFSNLNAIELFLKERALFIHQRSNGYYDTGPYFLSMLVCDLIPMRLFPMIMYAMIVYPMMGFQAKWDNFAWFILTLIVECLCSGALCYLMSAAIGVFMLANLAVSVAYVITMIFGGLLVNVQNLPWFIRWIQYLSFFKYGYESLAVTELHGLTFETRLVPGIPPVPVSGDQILADRGFDISNRPMDIIAMLILSLLFCFMSYLCLNSLTASKV